MRPSSSHPRSSRRPLLAALLVLGASLAPAALAAQAKAASNAAPSAARSAAADSAAVVRAARDYIEGWYTGDSTRMARAVHPRLVKRIAEHGASGSRLQEMTERQLVGAAGRGGGRNTPAAQRRADVRVLDVFGDIASVRVDARDWVDHLQLARMDGQWRIVNVLWEMRAP